MRRLVLHAIDAVTFLPLALCLAAALFVLSVTSADARAERRARRGRRRPS